MAMTGNTILVTVGTSGIGWALAEAFLQGDNRVIVAGRRQAMPADLAAADPGMCTAESDEEDAAGRSIFQHWVC